ncbi:hypothetical protein [Bradyrhizobium elkanii]|uniref:hypothetical protein n=1 Tax=Bradyrhizobium elkanii TaxID=29448 RepID=UPI0008413C5B|nr:hypothetical protein [Bradyrhizobium elkanii]ODM77792.1 hypothetical protein A6452_34520 [Bradyrhizobium elkanii]ODM81752.1 hypothetical protein A6X20_18995 [Bradyrhizobium elkanii]
MTPDESLEQHRRALQEHGQSIIVRRWSGPANARVPTEAVALGRPFGLKAEQLVGGIKAGDIKVILLNDPAAVVPEGKVPLSALLPLTSTDKLVLDGREISVKFPDDMTRRIAGVVIALEIIAGG